MEKTINSESNVGKRLSKVRGDTKTLIYNKKTVPLIGKITIGRDHVNSIVIDDKMVSRFHAEIQRIKDDFYIKDCNSSNGTYVNEIKVPKEKYIKLKSDDVIRVGRNELSIS